MSHLRLDELLSAELDHELGAAEQQELQQLLDTSDEAVAARRDYKKLDQLLRDMPEQLIPASLHHRITSSVRLPQAPPAANSSRFGNLFGDLWVSPVARFSFAAAAGILFSLAIFNAAGPDVAEAPTTDMFGTMIPRSSGQAGEILDQLHLKGTGFAAGATLLRRNQQLVLDIRLDAAGPIDITVDFENTGLRFASIANRPNDVDTVHFAAPVLQLRGAGQTAFEVLLDREDTAMAAESAAIRLEFSSDGLNGERGTLNISQ
ncbi:MAG: hypothetical protein WBN23_15620 [Woeseia sp.]